MRRYVRRVGHARGAPVTAAGSNAAAESPDVLTVDVHEGPDGGASVQLSGDLDLGSSPQFEQELGRLLATPRARMTIDLQGLAFVDSCGLRAILTAQRECEQAGCALTLIAGEQAQRLFDLTGVSESLPLVHPPGAQGRAPV
jgi:anti-sigma B factor antagonist